MSQAQVTRLINWAAIAVALVLLMLVGLHIYKKHFLAATQNDDFLFNDLPTVLAAPLTADIQQIVSAHIMGQVPKLVPQAKPVVKKDEPKPAAPKTKLDIILTGVIDGATPETGFAMIEIKRGKTAVLAVGESIGKTGAVLHQVLPGEVLVERDGVIESVKMKRKTLELAQQLPNESLIDLMGQDSGLRASANEGLDDDYNNTDENINYEEITTAVRNQAEISGESAGTGAQKKSLRRKSAEPDNSKVMRTLPIPKKLLRL